MPKAIHKYADLEVGDVVTFATGGPDLTVIGFDPPEPGSVPGHPGALMGEAVPTVRVGWFLSDGSFSQAKLPAAALDAKDVANSEPKRPEPVV